MPAEGQGNENPGLSGIFGRPSAAGIIAGGVFISDCGCVGAERKISEEAAMFQAFAKVSRPVGAQLARVGLPVLFFIALSSVACASDSGPRELILMTHDSFDIGENIIMAFEEEHDVTVQVLKSGDAGEMVVQAILTKDAPLADLMYGIDNTFLGRALEAEIFKEYRSVNLNLVPTRYRLDPTNHVMPVDFGFVNINYDLTWFGEHDAQPPADLPDLTEDDWKGLLVVENPATSSPGLAFLLSTIARFGETGEYTWKDFWADLRGNDVLVANGWEDAYYTSFSMYGGDRPLVVSYTTSPAAEFFYSEGSYDSPPTGNMTGPKVAFLQIEGIGILEGTNNEKLAEQFVDFVMDRAFQEDFPTRMWVYPANSAAALPAVFDFALAPEDPATVDPAMITANREAWIDEWTQIVLR
jgi:thiamine transport system substrate-binding protein